MRVTAATHRTHGASLLDAAARLFRARGMDGVSVADVAAAAGLTHGAFYGHFPSKAALAQAACRASFEQSVRRFRAAAAAARAAGGSGLDGVIDRYLSERHRDEPQDGCALAAMAPDLLRGGAELRGTLAEGAAALLTVVEEEILASHPAAAADRVAAAALGVLAAMTGGLIVARAFAGSDRSHAALAAAAAAARAAARL